MTFLDSDIISYYLIANEKVTNNIIELFDNEELICTTVINLYEIYKGFRWKNNRNSVKKFNDFLKYLSVYSIDNEVIDFAADIYADLRKRGKSTEDADILIAAIVIKNNGTLVTNNTKHFGNIKQLKVVNWV